MLYALGFVGLFTIGGMTGLFLASLALDVHLHDTYFVIAHFHYIMVGGAVMAFLGGMHFWWPKITGRMYPDRWARFAALTIFVGFNLTFFPQFILGYLGMPRRYHQYPPEFQVLEHPVVGGCVDSRHRVSAAARLPCLVIALRRARGSEPVACQGSGMANAVAAAHRQFRGDAGGDRGDPTRILDATAAAHG